MMRPDDRIVSPSRGTSAFWIAIGTSRGVNRYGDFASYVNTVYQIAPTYGIDASVVLAQSALETINWTDTWWTTRLNPAGMGVTGDPVQNLQSPTFANGADAAWGQVVHLACYCGLPVDDEDKAKDPRWQNAVDAGYYGIATILTDLNNRWAANRVYGQEIARRGNDLYPMLPDQEDDVSDIAFGKVPFPACDVRDIANNTAWDDLGPRTIRGVVWHRMLGTLWGTDGWFRGGGSATALTDYGLGVAAADGAGEAGHLMRWNDPAGRRSPWASGPVSAPYGDGKAFVDRYGVNAVNRDTTALEISGNQTTPLDDRARDVIAQFTAYWADRYKVGYDTFPLIPGEGNRSFVLWHEEICLGTGKRCPFEVVKAETDALIARTKAVLEKFQKGGSDVTYPEKPIPAPDELLAQGHALTVNKPNRFKCVQGQTLRTAPSTDAPAATSTPAKAGKVYTFDFKANVDGDSWLVSKNGSWALAKTFEAA